MKSEVLSFATNVHISKLVGSLLVHLNGKSSPSHPPPPPPPPTSTSTSTPISTNYYEFIHNNLLTVSNPFMPPHSLLTSVVELFTSPSSSPESLQNDLFGLLGEGGFDAMLGIVSSYEEIKAFLSSPTTPDVAAWIRKDSSPSPSFLPSVGQSQSSQSQIEEAKSLATIASLALLDSQQSQNQNRQSKTTPPPPPLPSRRNSEAQLRQAP